MRSLNAHLGRVILKKNRTSAKHAEIAGSKLSEWQLGEIQTSSKGVKSASLTADGQPIYVQLTSQNDPLSTPFGATSFNNEATTRLSIDFRCTPELQSFLERVDSWACIYLADHSERLFKGKVPEYRPSLQKKGRLDSNSSL